MKATFIFAILFFSAITSNALAQAWQQTNGPGGSGIESVIINNQGHIFVASNALLRSTDDGKSWMRIASELGSRRVWSIKLSPTGDLFILAVDSTPSIWRSIDDGTTWNRLQANVFDRTSWSITITPDGSIFVISSGNYYDGYLCFRSTDNGSSWVDVTPKIEGRLQNIWGDKAGHLFFNTSDYLYRSTDNGQNWSKILNGLTAKVFSLAYAPNGDLYAAGNILFKSTDGGRIWAVDSINAPYSFSQYSRIFITSKGRITIGSGTNGIIIVSDDNGINWRSFYPGNLSFPNTQYSDLLALSSKGDFYLNYSSTLFRSNFDTNSVWTRIDVPNGNVTALIAHPNGNLFAVSNYLWLSSDAGQHWQALAGGGVPIGLDSSLNILAGVGGYINRSSDGGATWNQASTILTKGTITGIAVRTKGEIFVSSSSEGVFRSTDNGITWDQLNTGITNQNISSFAVHQNGDVYAGSRSIVYKSTNIGLSWQKLNTNFPLNSGNVTALVVSTQGNIIAGIENAGVYWSTDNGATWSQKALGLIAKHINALVSTPSGKVFAATESGIFFLDIIPGANWIKLNTGLTALNVLSLCRDQSGRLFAGTDVSGVFRSVQTYNIIQPNGSLAAPILVTPANGAENIPKAFELEWNSVPDAESYQVTISKTPDFSTVETLSDYLTDTKYSYTVADLNTTFYWRVQAIGNTGVSIYSENWSFTTSSKADVQQRNAIANATSLASNYPNPFTASTTVPFTLSERSNITLEVIDPLGRILAVLAKGYYDAGSYDAKFNAEGLSAGMYFVRLRTEKQSFTKALEILK